MAEKFPAHDHFFFTFPSELASLAGLGWTGLASIERGGVSKRKEGEREDDDCWNFYKRISRLDWCKRNG